MMQLRILFFVLLLMAGNCIFPAPFAFCQELSPEQIFQKISPSIVTIFVMNGKENVAQGSGVMLNDSGWVVTNYHVFAGGDKITLKYKDALIEDNIIIGVDEERDILILKMEGENFPSLPIETFESLRVGQKVFTIGSPLGFENSLSEGIISGLRYSDSEGVKNLIQTTAPLSPGSSGGALVNAKGELIGISTQTVRGGQNLNFAIPISDVLQTKIQNLQDKKNSEAFDKFHRGKSLFHGGEDEKAIDYFEKSLALNPENETTIHFLAHAYFNAEKYDDALRYYQKVLEQNMHAAEDHYNLGIIYNRKNKYDDAVREFKKVIEENPEYVQAYNSLGLTYFKKENYDSALYFCKKATEIKPEYDDAYFSLGLVYNRKGYDDAAIYNYEKTIALNKTYENAYLNLSYTYLKKKDYDKTAEVLNEAIDQGSQNWRVYYNLAEVYYKLGAYEYATVYFMKALSKTDEMNHFKIFYVASIHYFLSVIQKIKGDKVLSKSYREKAFTLRPEWKKMKEKQVLELMDKQSMELIK